MSKIEVYTDGACSGNPGPGGWGGVIIDSGDIIELSGGEKDTTNNRMELTAVIESLRKVSPGSELIVTTDSQYVKKGITEWINNWIKNNWKTAAKKPVKNKDLWQELLNLSKIHEIEWKWVKGHSGHPQNERCDELARKEIDLLR